MQFSYIFKALILSFVAFLIIYAVSAASTQNVLVESNNYAVKDSVKESINLAKYRVSGDIEFKQDELIKSVITNYVKSNNIKADEVTFEIGVDEEKNIVTVKVYTSIDILDAESDAAYTFSYQVIER